MHRAVRHLLAGILCLMVAGALHAAPLAVVEAVQAPAWLERADRIVPLAPGLELRSGDTILTGGEARAYLLLADGSRVKLGEAAHFALHSQSLRPRESLSGALDVIAGAFRYTTGAIRRAVQRDLKIRVGTATVGIRGTDIWGRSSAERDIVALLEGRIEIARGGETLELAEPMTYLDAPRAGAARVRPLAAAQLSVWARETEILPGDGSARRDGRWQVRLATAATPDEALEIHDRLRRDGFDARIRPVGADAGWRYEIRLAGFGDRKEAAVVAARLAARGYAATVGR